MITLPIGNDGIDYERFKLKTRDFLRDHSDNLAFVKLRKNLPVTAMDLAELGTGVIRASEWRYRSSG